MQNLELYLTSKLPLDIGNHKKFNSNSAVQNQDIIYIQLIEIFLHNIAQQVIRIIKINHYIAPFYQPIFSVDNIWVKACINVQFTEIKQIL